MFISLFIPHASQGGFFAMEILDGYLYLHLDLGSGAIKLRASNRKLDEGRWHKVELIRNQRSGTVAVDEDPRTAFETPGKGKIACWGDFWREGHTDCVCFSSYSSQSLAALDRLEGGKKKATTQQRHRRRRRTLNHSQA